MLANLLAWYRNWRRIVTNKGVEGARCPSRYYFGRGGTSCRCARAKGHPGGHANWHRWG